MMQRVGRGMLHSVWSLRSHTNIVNLPTKYSHQVVPLGGGGSSSLSSGDEDPAQGSSGDHDPARTGGGRPVRKAKSENDF